MTLGRTRGARGRTRERQRDADRETDGLTESVVTIRRVAKTVAGGRRFTFNALVVVGDGKGKIGYGLGKASEVPLAVQKGGALARRSLVDVATLDSSVPQQVVGRFCGAQVLLRPAAPGTGVRASAAVRAVVQAAGVRDILTKSQGSNNPINVVQATIIGLQMMRDPQETMSLRRLVRGEAPLPENGAAAAPEPVSSDTPAPVAPEQPAVVAEQPPVAPEQPAVAAEQPPVAPEQPAAVAEQPPVVAEQAAVVETPEVTPAPDPAEASTPEAPAAPAEGESTQTTDEDANA